MLIYKRYLFFIINKHFKSRVLFISYDLNSTYLFILFFQETNEIAILFYLFYLFCAFFNIKQFLQ